MQNDVDVEHSGEVAVDRGRKNVRNVLRESLYTRRAERREALALEGAKRCLNITSDLRWSARYLDPLDIERPCPVNEAVREQREGARKQRYRDELQWAWPAPARLGGA